MGYATNTVRAIRACLVIGLAAAGPGTTAAQALDAVPPLVPGPMLNQGDLQALQNRLSRQQFQNQQQQFRQDDRNAVRVLPPPGQDVPRMRPGCQSQVYGNLADCR